MNHFKRLSLTLILMFVLSATTFAGETPTMPCAPGDILTPPCSSQSANDDSTDPGQPKAPPVSDNVDLVGLVETALWSLLMF